MPMRFALVTGLLIILAIITGCATPVGVRNLDPKTVQRTLTANVLSKGRLSPFTAQILNRFGLAEAFHHKPAQVIATIHHGLAGVPESDRLFALAELSFLHATKEGDRSYFLVAAGYAFVFLFPKDSNATPDPVDPRYRAAVDLYNRSIAEGLTSTDGNEVVLKAGAYKLPFGTLNLSFNESALEWGSYRLVHFKQAAKLGVRGLRNRYRWPGIGAPLTAAIKPLEGVDNIAYSLVPPNIKLPVTIFLRLEDVEEGMKSGSVQGSLELYTTEEATLVTIQGRQVPLEFELSSALADTLEGTAVYKTERKRFFKGDFSLPIMKLARFREGLFFMTPYLPNRIPVVLVHGTASSPGRWVEMFNELQNDRTLWGRYQFWLFTYNTGNPILYSGGMLAEALRKVVAALDPEGNNPALRKMVVIGHSQGGLLTRLLVTDSGTRFWDERFSVPFEQLQAEPETKELLKRSGFYTPLPFVNRVVFIATPHRGSFVAGGWIARLAGRFVSLSPSLLSRLQDVIVRNPQATAIHSIEGIQLSTDNMNPKNIFIKTLASLPIAPGVKTHSIIAVKNPEKPSKKWNDGVVSYSSAHLDGVTSELVVHSSHSTQSQPQTIEEVRRILLDNLE